MRKLTLFSIQGLLVLGFALASLLPAATAAAADAARATTTTAARKPTFVLVHGAWGGGWAFKKVDELLTADGYKVYRPTLTGQGERVHLATPEIGLETHIMDVVNTILYEDLHDVVLMGHSYGGMVITGVADRVPDRIKHIVYLDALLPENGESLNTAFGGGRGIGNAVNGFIPTSAANLNKKPPHDVPHPAKTLSDPVVLKNQDAVKKIPTNYILTVDKGSQPERDGFYKFYQRAKGRGWPTEIMEGDHNVQWSHPEDLARRLENAAK